MIDPRVIQFDSFGWKFKCRIEGRNLTITKIRAHVAHGEDLVGWFHEIKFRLYDPENENAPESFDSSERYIYYGLVDERAPYDIKEAVVAYSVKKIKRHAFSRCADLKICTMGDSVETIEREAFEGCSSLKNIRFSRTLRSIGTSAFCSCSSLDCLFVPSNIEEIGVKAFYKCMGMKFLVLPTNIALDRIDLLIVERCDSLLVYPDNEYGWDHSERIHDEVKHRYDHLPLLRICINPDVTVQNIQNFATEYGTSAFYQTEDKYGMLPLHILSSVNAFASEDVLLACFDANPSALFAQDREGSSPLAYFWNNSMVDTIVHLIQDLCINWRHKNTKDEKQEG